MYTEKPIPNQNSIPIKPQSRTKGEKLIRVLEDRIEGVVYSWCHFYMSSAKKKIVIAVLTHVVRPFLWMLLYIVNGMTGYESEINVEWTSLKIYTWNTVRTDCGNVSKWLLTAYVSSNLPPKICIPNNENMKMKRNKITSSEVMDVIDSTSDLIKLPKEAQYLKHTACNAVKLVYS